MNFKNLCALTLQLTSSQIAHAASIEPNEFVKGHPIVEVDLSLTGIRMEVRGNHDYYGHIFVGSDKIETRVKFDTMSQWSVLLQQTTVGGDILNSY